jgi:phosphoribosylglycinamide formyltransferase-1
MFRVAVLVSGGGTNLQAIIDRVKDGSLPGVGIVRVISNNAGAYALTRAKNAGIEGVTVSPKEYETRELFDKALLRAVKEASPDLIVLAGFLVTIPPELIREYPDRIINIHPSLIPSFCGKGCYGLHVHEKALARGVKVTGATVHFVNEGLDSGPIILQKPVAVEDGDTPEILQKRVMEQAEWIILPRAIGLIAEGRVSVENGITHIAPKKQG